MNGDDGVDEVVPGHRVVDLSTGIPGAYCTKLLADAGADVIKVEPASGDPLRFYAASGARPAGDGALFRFLHHGKRAVTGSPGSDAVHELVESADLVVVGDEQGAWADDGYASARSAWERDPALVLVSITPYGRSGPLRDRPATHFTIEAEAGSLAMRSRPGIDPFQAGGRIAYWVAGAYAAVASSACLRRSRRRGHGELVDLSIHEVMTVSGSLFIDMMSSLLGRPEWPTPAGTLETPSIEPTADGWIGFNTNTRQQWEDFCVLIGRADLVADETLASAAGRMARWDDWNEIVHSATRARSTADLLRSAGALRIPVAPVCSGESVMSVEHFIEREVFVDAPDGEFVMPAVPYLIDGRRPTVGGESPGLGEHDGKIEPRAPSRVPASEPVELPLADLAVVDLTSWWAGPAASNMLAVLGADVVKVESIQRPDGMRYAGVAGPGVQRWWEYGFMFLCANTDKRAVTLDLGTKAGRDALLELVARADVVLENFSPRVMEGFDLDWDVISSHNPRAVMVRMPAFGLDGPWRDHVGFAQTMEQVTGMAWTTGHVDDQPRIPRGPCDPNAGMHAVFALLAALDARDRTGSGVLVEVPMVESALNVAAELVVEFSAYGNVVGRDGNRSPDAAPQGLYRCIGEADAAFLALSVATDAHWKGLKAVLGEPAWAGAASFGTVEGRRRDHDRIDALIANWCRRRTVDQAVGELLAHGVPAAGLCDTRATSRHVQHVARGFYEDLDHPVVGRHSHPGAPFRFASVRSWLDRPAPTLGEHNHEVLAEIGYSDETISRLAAEKVIGTEPLGA